MAWDDAAKRLAIKVIGTIESNLKYDAIYYSDAITIGIVQWYAGRAANILEQLTTAPAWAGVASAIKTELAANPAATSWTYWSRRYLTKAEGESLKPLLTSTQGVQVQNAQIIKDFDEYAKTAKTAGLDPDKHTAAFIFWCTMHHQSPREAGRVLSVAGVGPTMDRLYSIAMNNSVFSKYKSRYDKAKSIINSGDSSGIPDVSVTPSEDTDGGDVAGDGLEKREGGISYIQAVGEALHVKTRTGIVVCYPGASGNYFYPYGTEENNESGPEITPPSDPETGPTTPPTSGIVAKRNAVANWMTSRIGKFKYSQGTGRMNSDSSGVGDCSSTVYQAYFYELGIKLGETTYIQVKNGTRVWANHDGPYNTAPPQSVMAKGDLVLFWWKSSAPEHVEMYIEGDTVVGHGGPGNGPKIRSLASLCKQSRRVEVRRIIS